LNHMAAERDLELLDDYLANRLDEKGKSAFEQKLNTDPDLKNEYDLQQQFVEGIKKARVAELKAIMNNVPIPAGHSTGAAVAGKIALWAVVIAVVGTGIYFYMDEDGVAEKATETSTEQPKETPADNDTDADTDVQPESVSPQPEGKDEAPVVSEEPASSEHKPGQSPKAIRKGKTSDKTAEEPAIDVYDPTKDTAENSSTPPKNEGSTLKENNAPSMEVEVETDNKEYNFHYQFKEGKLILYGPFEQNLYEIMDFFSDDKHTMFLFYNTRYYLLKDEDEKLKALKSIQDPVLLKKLKEYRNN
jgi:hypothetical protein